MYKLIRPLLFAQDAETAHDRMHRVGSFLGHSRLKKVLRSLYQYEDPRLQLSFHGIHFANPVGLAAGFDKTADLIDLLPAIGFGYTEIGSVTALARAGNPRPRLFRLQADHAIVNRMGLNNKGADATAAVIAQRTDSAFPLGVNIAKTHDPEILGEDAIADFVYTTQALYESADYITLNVSCPNTAEGKTFEEPQALSDLLSAIMSVRASKTVRKPILVKFSPDRTEKDLEKMLAVTTAHDVDGYVLTNTSSGRAGLITSPDRIDAIGMGGLSGAPICDASTRAISFVYQYLEKPFIIGVGGIFSAEDAYEKICAGATLVQAYTGVVYEGPAFARNINKGLVKLLERDGFSSIQEAVGFSHQ